jgi:uncharacterized protein YeaO (DUF488 family)
MRGKPSGPDGPRPALEGPRKKTRSKRAGFEGCCSCHRNSILVARNIIPEVTDIRHIHSNGRIETRFDLEDRLIDLYGTAPPPLLRMGPEREIGEKMKLYTIGFTKSTAQNFFSRLKLARVTRVIDTRANRTSQLSGFSKEKDLRYFLQEIAAIGYYAEELLAPEKGLLKAYRSNGIGWDEYARRYVSALDAKNVDAHFRSEHRLDHTCLLCSEHEPDFCHRRLAAEYLQESIDDIEIDHL